MHGGQNGAKRLGNRCSVGSLDSSGFAAAGIFHRGSFHPVAVQKRPIVFQSACHRFKSEARDLSLQSFDGLWIVGSSKSDGQTPPVELQRDGPPSPQDRIRKGSIDFGIVDQVVAGDEAEPGQLTLDRQTLGKIAAHCHRNFGQARHEFFEVLARENSAYGFFLGLHRGRSLGLGQKSRFAKGLARLQFKENLLCPERIVFQQHLHRARQNQEVFLTSFPLGHNTSAGLENSDLDNFSNSLVELGL